MGQRKSVIGQFHRLHCMSLLSLTSVSCCCLYSWFKLVFHTSIQLSVKECNRLTFIDELNGMNDGPAWNLNSHLHVYCTTCWVQLNFSVTFTANSTILYVNLIDIPLKSSKASKLVSYWTMKPYKYP